jgi:hypothetical protein
VSVGLQLGINQLVVDSHFETPPIGRDQRDRLDFWLKLFDKLGRQTDSPIRIVSDCAVNQVNS